PAFRHAYNGLLNLADWLGSNRRFFEFADADEGRMPFARERAAELLGDMHLDPENARRVLGEETVSFRTIAGLESNQEPYDIQQKCFDLPVDSSGNLTVLESDTGSGKTEAAIARFVRLFQQGEVDGLYFAVPTRSAAKQLQDRVRKALQRLIPDEDDRPPTVLAVPGYVRIDDLDGDPNALPGYDVQWPDDRPNMTERGWAAESSKRYLAGAVAVGTVDQVLLSALQVNHAHLRAAALHRHFLVVDEVHSSEPYMRRVLQKVLDHHLDAGGHAMLMSATLGTDDRVTYTEGRNTSPPPLEEATEEDYPLLTHVGADRREPETHHEESSDYEKHIDVELSTLAAEPTAIARRAIGYAREGARVLVIRNVVSDCLAAQMGLEEIADSDAELLFGPETEPAPHHSRFAAGDRRCLDQAIEDHFGKAADGGSVVAIATQTVEQSLDIDADVMLTDLCPADVLLQRIGRLHRHPDRERPDGFETARVEVLVPEERDLSTGIVETGERAGSGLAGEHGLGTVYRDLRVLEATWRQLEQDDQWTIPRDNRRLVERTTHPERLKSLVQELDGRWETHETHILGERLGEGAHSELVTIDRGNHFKDNGFLTDIEGIKTRLGTDDWTVTFDPPEPGPFGESIETLSVPDYWLHATSDIDEEDLTARNVEHTDDRLEFTAAGRRFIYDRLGLRPADT
ncbi:MAG: CRISPR-associated helicase Cas3', partial [Bradymonadaceae bacterium]